jgi:hypothetical protein
MVKDLKGISLGREVMYGDFVDMETTLFVQNKNLGGAMTGKIGAVSLKYSDAGGDFEKMTEILAFKSKTSAQENPALIFTKTPQGPKTPFVDTFGFSGIGGTKPASLKVKPVSILNTDYLLGETTIVAPSQKVTTPQIKIQPKVDIFDLDIFSSTRFGKIKEIPTKREDLISSNKNEFQELTLNLNPKTKALTRQELKTKTKEVSVLNWGLDSLQKKGALLKPQVKIAEKSLLAQNTRDMMSFSTLQRQAIKQKTVQQQKTPQTQLEKTQRLTRPQKPEPFGFDFGFKFGEEKVKKGKPKEKDILDWGFIAEVRRQGKFKPVSKAVSKKEAFLIGEDIVKNTLGASFRVKKTAKKIKVKKKPSAELSWLGNSEFYKKQERGEDIFIQKKEKRLSTKGERKEIQKSKRAKQKSFF